MNATTEIQRNGRLIGRVVDGCPESTGECDDVPAFWSYLRHRGAVLAVHLVMTKGARYSPAAAGPGRPFGSGRWPIQ